MAGTKVDDASGLFKLLEESQGEFLVEALKWVLHRVMEAEVSALCKAERHERTPQRRNHRNGLRRRTFETRLGCIELAIPKLRRGSYFPSFLEARRRWEKAFVQVVCEAYVRGVSTRKVEALVEAMGARGVSKSEVSRMAQELDEMVEEFRHRRLTSRAYPYVWLDALYLKVRQGGRVVDKAVLVAYGVNAEGRREVLGFEVADGEMSDAWRAFLSGLVRRGLGGVKLVISDAHSGLAAARRDVLNATSWQRCRVHFMRNVLARVPKKAQPLVSATLKQVFSQPTYAEACTALRAAVQVLAKRYPQAAAVVEQAEADVLAYKQFPEAHWRQIHSTNPLERLNREIRRRTDVVGIFPNDSAVLRLVGALLMEQNDEWQVARRYFSLESMAGLLDEEPSALEGVPPQQAALVQGG